MKIRICLSVFMSIIILAGCSQNYKYNEHNEKGNTEITAEYTIVTDSNHMDIQASQLDQLLDNNEIQQINISFSPSLFQAFDIVDKEQISTVADYLISLNPIETELNPKDYRGGGYSIKIRLKDNTERVFILMGNKFFVEKDKFTYEIPYEKATRFDTIVANILQHRQIQNGDALIEGTVISIEAGESGNNISCIIRDKDNITLNVYVNNAKIIDASGNGWMVLHKNDVIKVFYQRDTHINASSIVATTVYIINAAQ